MYLVGFGHHVLVDDVHVGCGQRDQSWDDQFGLPLLKTCKKTPQKPQTEKQIKTKPTTRLKNHNKNKRK